LLLVGVVVHYFYISFQLCTKSSISSSNDNDNVNGLLILAYKVDDIHFIIFNVAADEDDDHDDVAFLAFIVCLYCLYLTDCDQSNGVYSSTELTHKHYSYIQNENLNPVVFESSKSDHGFPSYKHPK